MKKILFLVNHYIVIYNFRLELLKSLKESGYDVYIALPHHDNNYRLEALGCEVIETKINRHGKNIVQDILLLNQYIQIIKKIKPNVVLSFTVKPNIYGGLATRWCRIPFIPTVTGLGTAIENQGMLQSVVMNLYKVAFRNARKVFFQNNQNYEYFANSRVKIKDYKLVNGSGVNLSYFSELPYPLDENIKYVFIGRVMKDKGIEEYIQAAEEIKKQYPNTEFHICGFCEDGYRDRITEFEKKGVIQYHGMVDDVREIFRETHCTVLPSYHEGLSNVLLESAASGRPVIASKISGCKETFEEGRSGLGIEVKSVESLIGALLQFYKFPWEEKRSMGQKGRQLMEKKFSREKVVKEYMSEIQAIVKA